MNTYTDIRPQLRSGDVLAWKGTGFLSNVIKALTHGVYSHVGIVWVFEGRVYVLEAREGQSLCDWQGGVQLTAASHAIHSAPCDWVQTKVDWTPAIQALALASLGKPYAYAAAIEAGFGLTPPQGAAICSVYAGSVLAQAGVPLPSQGATPQALVDDLLLAGCVLQSVHNSADDAHG